MTQPTDDTNPIDLAAGYVLDDLSPEEAARLRQALAENPTVSQEIKSFEETLSLLPYGLPTVEPAADLKSKILSAASRSANPAASPAAIPTVSSPADGANLETSRSNVVPITSAHRAHEKHHWQRWMPAISTGIAAVAIAALGLNQIRMGTQQSQQTLALQQQLEATNAELTQLRSELEVRQRAIALLSEPGTQVLSLVGELPDSAEPNAVNSSLATARVLAKPGALEVTLVAQGLPELPEDKVYRYWSLTKDSTDPTYCGQFRQDDSGTAQWVVPDAICTETPLQLMITVDSPDDPHTLGGQVVMQGAT